MATSNYGEIISIATKFKFKLLIIISHFFHPLNPLKIQFKLIFRHWFKISFQLKHMMVVSFLF